MLGEHDRLAPRPVHPSTITSQPDPCFLAQVESATNHPSTISSEAQDVSVVARIREEPLRVSEQSMGISQSSPSEAVPRSPSAAFGRLRIDSPDARKIHHRIRSARSLVALDKVSSTGDLRHQAIRKVLLEPSVLSERSPLLHRYSATAAAPTMLSPQPPPKIGGSSAFPPAWWIVPALICATCYALYNIFIKLGSSSIHPVLGGVILQFVAALLGSFLLVGIIVVDGVDELNYDMEGIWFAILAGVAVGAAEMLSFVVSGMGVPSSKSIPVIIGGSVGIGCAMGMVFLHEYLGVRGMVGVAMIVLGVVLVGTDPNTSL